VDLTEVLDFRSILECHHRNGELPQGVIVLEDKFSSPVFSLQNRPGNFLFLLQRVVYMFKMQAMKLELIRDS